MRFQTSNLGFWFAKSWMFLCLCGFNTAFVVHTAVLLQRSFYSTPGLSLSLLLIRLKFAICSKLQVFKPKISQDYRGNYFEKVDGKLLSISFFPSHMIEVSYWFHVGVRRNCSTLFLLTTNWVKGDSNLDSSIRQCHEVTKFLCLFLQLNIMTIEHQFEQISNMKIGRLTSPF